MVLILLSLTCNNDNLKLKLDGKKRRYLDDGWLLIGRFKVRSVQGMINKEAVAQFTYKPV